MAITFLTPVSRMPDSLTLTDATFPDAVEQSSGLTLVNFWAPWSPPCILLAPVVDRDSRVYADRVQVAMLNVDDTPAQIWFSDDANRYPVQLKTKFSRFSLTLSLQSVTAGDAAAHPRLLAAALER